MSKPGAWFSHVGDEFAGRICIKQKAGGWAIIREAADIGGPAKGFCSLAHGTEPARANPMRKTRPHQVEKNSCISVVCMAPRCAYSSPDQPCEDLPEHCVQGHVWIEA